MARVRKFKPTKKKTYMQSFADILTDALLGEEEKSPAEINAAALRVSGENISDINLEKYNAPGGLREQNEAIVPYVIETPFDATSDSAKAFDFSDKSRHIAEGFLAAYKGNGLVEADSSLASGNFIAKDGPLGKGGALGRFGVTEDYGLDVIYGAHDSDPAKRMRTELAEKLDAFEAQLAVDISERSLSHDAMKAKKDAFMREIGVFFNSCDREIFHRGVGMSTRDESRSIISDRWHNRYDYEAYYEHINDHLTTKLEASQQLNEQFHLWQGAVAIKVPAVNNPALTEFLKQNKPLTAEDVGLRFESELAALKKAYDRDAFTLVTRLDNNPNQIGAAKMLKASYTAKFAECLQQYAAFGIGAQVQPAAAVITTHGGSLPPASTVTTATVNKSLREQLFGATGSLASIDTIIRAQAVTKITTFEEAKSRLQHWRYDYDLANSGRYDKVFDKTTEFTNSAEAALKAIEALEPKYTGAAPAPTLGETFEGTISNTHGYEDQLTALETTIKTKIKAGEDVDLGALTAALTAELAVPKEGDDAVAAKIALDKITAAYPPIGPTPLAKLEASYKAYGTEPVSVTALAALDKRVLAIRTDLETRRDVPLPDEPLDVTASNYAETKAAYDLALKEQKAANDDLAKLDELDKTFQAARTTELTTRIDALHLACKEFADSDPKVLARLTELNTEIAALRKNFADRPLCPTAPLEPDAPPSKPDALPTTPAPTLAAITKHEEDTKLYDAAKVKYDTAKLAYDTAKPVYDAAKLAYDTAKPAYDSANPLAAKLDAIEAYYLPPDARKLDSSIAEHAKSFASLKLDLVELQDEFAKETRALLKIEFLCDRLQAEHDLNVLKVEYQEKFKALTEELSTLNENVQNLKEDNLNASLVTDKQVFATQVAALIAAQQKALTETIDFAAQDRAQSTKDFQEYDLKYHLFLLKHGADAAPTPAEIAKYDPRAELKALSDETLLDDRMDFGLMSVSKRPGKNGNYEIHLCSGSSLGKAENISTDEEWAGQPTWGYLISHFMNRESRSAEIRDTLTNPEKLDGVGRALQLILDEKMQKTPTGPRELSCQYDAYTPDNWNSMLAQHFAAIPLGIDMDPGVSFDKSFKGEKYGKYEITHTMPKAIRAEKRAEFIRLVEERKAAYQLSGQFNGACRALLVDGALEPKKMVDLKPAQKVFLSALSDNVNRDYNKPYDDKAAVAAVARIEALSFKNIKGLMADGGAMNGRAASMLGDVLEKDFAVQVLARKEREITALMHFAEGPPVNNDLVNKAKQLQQQLSQDYTHVASLANKQGIASRGSIYQQSAAVISGLNAMAAPRDLDVREKINEVGFKARGKEAEVEMKAILATTPTTITSSRDLNIAKAALDELAHALEGMAAGRERSKKQEEVPVEKLINNGAVLRDWQQFNAVDLDKQLTTYKSVQEPKIQGLEAQIAELEKDPRAKEKHKDAKVNVATLEAAHSVLVGNHQTRVDQHKALVVEYKALVADHAAEAAKPQPDPLELQNFAILIAKKADAISEKVKGTDAILEADGITVKTPGVKGHEELALEIERSTIAITDAKKTLAALPLEQATQDLKVATAELAAVTQAHAFLSAYQAPIKAAIASFDAAFAVQERAFDTRTKPTAGAETFYADSCKALDQLVALTTAIRALPAAAIVPAQRARLEALSDNVMSAYTELTQKIEKELESQLDTKVVPEEGELDAARIAIDKAVMPPASKEENNETCDALESIREDAKSGIDKENGALDDFDSRVLPMESNDPSAIALSYAKATEDLVRLNDLKEDIESLKKNGGTKEQLAKMDNLLTEVTQRISAIKENATAKTEVLLRDNTLTPEEKIAVLEAAIAFHKANPETEPKPSSARFGILRFQVAVPDEPLVKECKVEIATLEAGIVAANGPVSIELDLAGLDSDEESLLHRAGDSDEDFDDRSDLSSDNGSGYDSDEEYHEDSDNESDTTLDESDEDDNLSTESGYSASRRW